MAAENVFAAKLRLSQPMLMALIARHEL